MAGSFEVAGLRVDHGSHRLHPATPPDVLGALRELLGDDLQTRPRHGRIRLLDRWLAFPLRTGDLLRRTPPAFAARAARRRGHRPAAPPRADTFAEVVRAGLGPAVLDAFYGPYARKLWDADAADLAGELARRRVSAASPADIVRRLARGATPRGPRRSSTRAAGSAPSPRRSPRPRRARAPTSDWAAAVTGLQSAPRTGPGGPSPSTAAGPLDADQVWSTAPLPALVGMVDPPAPDEAVAAASGLRHRALVLLYLVLDRPRWTEFDAHYFPGPEVLAARVSEPRNYRDDPGQPDDRTVLCAEIACWAGDEVWSAPDEELAGRLAAELGAAGLPEPRPVAVESRRLARVYPVYRPGADADLAAVEAWAGGLGGLITFGRQGLFTPDNTHHALAMGWDAADSLRPDGSLDAERWRARRDGFRSFVVED